MPFEVGQWVRLGGDGCSRALRGCLARVTRVFGVGFYEIVIPGRGMWHASRGVLQPLTETELVCCLLEQE